MDLRQLVEHSFCCAAFGLLFERWNRSQADRLLHDVTLPILIQVLSPKDFVTT